MRLRKDVIIFGEMIVVKSCIRGIPLRVSVLNVVQHWQGIPMR